MDSVAVRVPARVHLNLLYGLRPAVPSQPHPPAAGRSAVYIRKRNNGNRSPQRAAGGRNSESEQCSPLLPAIRENSRPVSPFLQKAHPSPPSLPLRPPEDLSRHCTRPFAPCNRSSIRVDLKRGSFSGKHTMRDSQTRSSLTVDKHPSDSVLCEEEARKARSPSRLQRISKGFQLDKQRLQAGIKDVCRRTQSTIIGGDRPLQMESRKRTLTPQPDELPWAKFISALDSVTRIRDKFDVY